ncbi:hypothetical protein [uncultured Ruminococcus sp.]|uniref:ORC-CDC6 family AAA ATPase n=1 Tax=uncultured Ruminococcus sp. TaxID=165186 RepID=UPI00261D1558|nr:hypothetical protein [uncultured Ruminococcus sp.]
MNNQYNPFKENRTEQMRDLWKYYVPFPGLDSAGKPLVVEGGRGSGKTMFFQCNSWRQKTLAFQKNCSPITELLNEDFIGIYYRVDTTFVSSMRNREEEKWDSIFETYLGICILKEILDLLLLLNRSMNLNGSMLSEFALSFSKKLNVNSTTDSIERFRKDCDVFLDIIEDKINGSEISPYLRYINVNRFITDVCVAISGLLDKEDLLFKVFIDEYETLQEYQQKIVNTLIKHSSLPVIFNIGLRPKGMKTSETISNTETIESPHDYELLFLGFEQDKYPEIIKSICQKRIALGKEQGKIPVDASEDIEFYLNNYSIEYEISIINQCKRNLPYIEKLHDLIIQRAKDENSTNEEIIKYCNYLCDNAPILNSRMHYALLYKKTQFTPSIKELYESYLNQNERYNDWLHNRKNGVMYLLCKEVKRDKMYFGFDVFSALSSNIVRYFLELCEQAFKIAFLNDWKWETPISPEIQTEAAKYVSEYKIIDIAGYEPYGKELRIFVQYIGQIFNKLHTSENNTLGEPEPNHFNTKDLSLPDSAKKIIASAIMWNVLQEGETTKKKQSKLSPETVDYYLNKIYVPYFGISYRNQRKIFISVEILQELLSGNEELAVRGFKRYFKNSDVQTEYDNQLPLFDMEVNHD